MVEGLRWAIMQQAPSERCILLQPWDIGKGALFDIAVEGRLHASIKDSKMADLLVVVPRCEPGREDGDAIEGSKLLLLAAAAADVRFLFLYPENLRALSDGRPLVSPFEDEDFIEGLLRGGAASTVICGCQWQTAHHELPLRLVSNLAAFPQQSLSKWPQSDRAGSYSGPLPSSCSRHGRRCVKREPMNALSESVCAT